MTIVYSVVTHLKTMKPVTKILIGLNLILITSCRTTFYIPNTQNVPLIKEKGEWEITTASNNIQMDLQGAYGLGDATALQLNTFIVFPGNLFLNDGVSGGFIELGGGYYKNLSDHLLFDTYMLAGIGHIENLILFSSNANSNSGGEISANFARYGLQPSISYMTDYFSISASSRLVNLSHYKIHGDLYNDGIDQIYYLNEHNSNFLIEPAITVKGGWEIVKLQVQYLRSFNVSNPHFPQDDEVWTVGISVHF